MSLYLNWAVNDLTDKSHSQEELRRELLGSRADVVFFNLMGSQLTDYVGHINRIFVRPRSQGLSFRFKPGKRKAFVELIDPGTRVGNISAFDFSQPPKASPLIPDNPGVANPYQMWRKLASLKGIGASYRQEGTGSSLHVAFNDTECDVHVDRAGFIVRDAMGRITWDHNGLVRHLFIDLASDFRGTMPLPLVSLGVKDSNNQPVIDATLAPWLSLDLPSKANGNKWSMVIGMALTGEHTLFDGS